jgi:hypothetical protein
MLRINTVPKLKRNDHAQGLLLRSEVKKYGCQQETILFGSSFPLCIWELGSGVLAVLHAYFWRTGSSESHSDT